MEIVGYTDELRATPGENLDVFVLAPPNIVFN